MTCIGPSPLYSRSLLLLTQQHRQVRLNNAEMVAIGHWARPMSQKSRVQRRESTIADESAPLAILKTPLFAQAQASRPSRGQRDGRPVRTRHRCRHASAHRGLRGQALERPIATRRPGLGVRAPFWRDPALFRSRRLQRRKACALRSYLASQGLVLPANRFEQRRRLHPPPYRPRRCAGEGSPTRLHGRVGEDAASRGDGDLCELVSARGADAKTTSGVPRTTPSSSTGSLTRSSCDASEQRRSRPRLPRATPQRPVARVIAAAQADS